MSRYLQRRLDRTEIIADNLGQELSFSVYNVGNKRLTSAEGKVSAAAEM